MGKYAEQGKKFKIFNPDFKYKIKLLFGVRYVFETEDKQIEEIVYYCKAHEKTYRIVKIGNDFVCDEYVLDEWSLAVDAMIGIGDNEEITVNDLDMMFGEWEEYCKKLKPVNDDTIAKLVEAVPELKGTMQD